jgi:hypothetical protein
MRLQKVEREFRAMKTGLPELRPAFVRKEERTRGRVFRSMLALKIAREIERCWRTAFGATDTNPDVLAALGRLCLLDYQIAGGSTVTRLPVPNQSQTEILNALAVSLPASQIQPADVDSARCRQTGSELALFQKPTRQVALLVKRKIRQMSVRVEPRGLRTNPAGHGQAGRSNGPSR